MRILFTYNARIECDEEGDLFGNEINNYVINRYKLPGDEITFIARKRLIKKGDSSSLTRLDQNAFRIVFVPEFNSIFQYLINIVHIKKIVKEEVSKANVIIARTPSTLSRVAVKYSKLSGKPYLIEVVGCPWDALWNYSFLGKMLAPYAFYRMKAIVSSAPFVIYVTSKFLQKRYPNKHEHVSISDVILPKPEYQVLESKIFKLAKSFERKKIILGTAAGLDIPYKGHILVLKAINQLKNHGYVVKYLLVGKGSGNKIMEVATKLGIADCIEIGGQLPFNKMPIFYDDLDIYVQPSLQEGLPRSVIEAMNRACPCIGSNVGGIPELLEDSVILKKHSAEELVSLITKKSAQEWIYQAERNFIKVKEFEADFLQKKRMDFFNQFKQFYHLW